MDQKQTEPQANKYSLKIQVTSLLVTVFVVTIAVGIAFALEFGGWGYLRWATKHPALTAKYDPHHWLGRIAASVILFSIGHALVSVVRRPLATFRAWRRVFVLWPWERREAKGREAERLVV